jgi:hypothetical protein
MTGVRSERSGLDRLVVAIRAVLIVGGGHFVLITADRLAVQSEGMRLE